MKPAATAVRYRTTLIDGETSEHQSLEGAIRHLKARLSDRGCPAMYGAVAKVDPTVSLPIPLLWAHKTHEDELPVVREFDDWAREKMRELTAPEDGYTADPEPVHLTQKLPLTL